MTIIPPLAREIHRRFIRERTCYTPVKFYQELAEAIVYSKEETAAQIVEAYIHRLQTMSTITPAYLQYLCTELWTIFAYSLYSVGIVLDELFQK